MMKQREWMGYAAAVLAAGAFLTGCGNIRKLAKSDPEVGVHLPARSAQNPVAKKNMPSNWRAYFFL